MEIPSKAFELTKERGNCFDTMKRETYIEIIYGHNTWVEIFKCRTTLYTRHLE